jgi:DNA (cytosine-5)-methyltransferase 1
VVWQTKLTRQIVPRVRVDDPSPTVQTHGNLWTHSELAVPLEIPPAPPPDPAKPPYAVPSMAEIRQIPKNGYKLVSTFSGAGGSCLGFRLAGFSVVWANEFVPAAVATYVANAEPGTRISDADIRQITAVDIVNATGIPIGEIDCLEGSPPCASFSTAGKREKKWGQVSRYSDTAQRSDDLFFEFVRLLRELQPKTFVAENVSGLVKGIAKGYFKIILRAMIDAGYNVRARLLDAQWLGVPQKRQRIIFVGVRSDLDAEPRFPDPLQYRYSVRDAIPWLGSGATIEGATGFDRHAGYETDIPMGAILADRWVNVSAPERKTIAERRRTAVESGLDVTGYAIGDEWDKLRAGEQSPKFFSLVRTDPDDTAGTLTASGGDPSIATILHPFERRKFSIPELRRICSFPDDFELTGTYAQQWERLGRAVPPLMARAVAVEIAAILDAINRKDQNQ